MGGLKSLSHGLDPLQTLVSLLQNAERRIGCGWSATVGGAPWLPENLSLATLGALDAEMADLARRSGVSSWLFA